MKKTGRSTKERVADTYWPMVVHPYRTLYGPFLGRVMACSFGCQPPSWFKADISKLKHDNIEAFLSPAYRRRFRNVFKKEWRTEVKEARREGINVRQIARETLSDLYEGLREELSTSDIEELSNGEIKAGWPPFAELEKQIERIDLSHIPKVAQVEAEQNRKAEEIVKNAKDVATSYDALSTISRSVRKEILVQVGGREGYVSTVADILALAETNPLSITDSIGGKARKALIRLLYLEELEKQLETMQFPQGFRILGKIMGKSIKLLMTEQGKRIPALLIGECLIAQFANHPYSKHRRELPLPDDIERMKAEAVWAQPTNLSEAEGREAIVEALANRGIDHNDLTPKEWTEIFEKYDLIDKGYEFSSKTGVSISSFYGEAAHAKEQKWSRVINKIRKQSR